MAQAINFTGALAYMVAPTFCIFHNCMVVFVDVLY